MSDVADSGAGVLHWYGAGPDQARLLELCAATAGSGDTVVLMGEAVLAALAGRILPARQGAWCVLNSDLAAFGIDPGRLQEGITCIDHGELVRLSCAYPKIQSWP